MTAPTCARCGHITHPTVVAGSRFKRPLDGYRDAQGGPTRATRAEAENGRPCPTLRGLATIWMGHDDYRQEWA